MLTRFKQLSFSFVLLGFSTLSWSQAVLVKSQQNIEEYKLDNGLRVVLAPNEKANKVFINTIYLTGSLNDPKGKGGMAHLLEHLAFKGTQDVQGEAFQRRLDQYTLSTNASTEYYTTRYTNIVRADQQALDQVLYLESQRMNKLVLQDKYVPSEIEIVKREREVRLDQPFAVLIDQMFKAFYGNRYLGRLPIGDLPELKSINMQELEQFYRTWYAPNNAVMVISGKFDKSSILQTIDKNFAQIPSRAVPAPVQVPALDPAKIQPRQFLVEKGSDLAKYNIYSNKSEPKLQPALALAPLLYTMQPSGSLYKSIVETGTATNVEAATWLDQNFNLVFLGAVYSPSQNATTVESALAKQVEQFKPFDDIELKRVKQLMQTQIDLIQKDPIALGSRLSDYIASTRGDWGRYYQDVDDVKKLDTTTVNQIYREFFTASHRVVGDIKPTPESQKKAMAQQAASSVKKTLDQQTEAPEPLKDISEYQREIQQFTQRSKQEIESNEKKIVRGQLSNGMQYALFPTETRDDRTYATLSVDFGTEQSLFGKSAILDLTSYLLLRGSEQYNLQQVADKSIEAGGSASAAMSDNGMVINIQANKDQFNDFFHFIIEMMKKPSFEQSQFDLIKSQSLASLDRPYTEPETVAALTMARLVETYQPGDLRYHFEPELAKTEISKATQAQVKALYDRFFAMNHARISVTGDFDPVRMKQTLNQNFANWNNQEPYKKLMSEYTTYPAQKVHALSEQREFGNYQALLTFPVGTEHPDAPAMLVLAQILGDSQISSRLAVALREKNALVYGFGSDVDLDPDLNNGVLSISANYTAGKADQLSSLIHEVLQEMIQKGVTDQEVAAAKANIMKKRVTSLEDERNIHRMLNGQMEYKKTLKDRLKRDQEYATITKADVDRVIKKYIQLDHLVEVMADQYGQAQSVKRS